MHGWEGLGKPDQSRNSGGGMCFENKLRKFYHEPAKWFDFTGFGALYVRW